MRLLILAHDKELIKKLKSCLKRKYTLDFEQGGGAGVYSAQAEFYSLVIVDHNLEDISGARVCRLMRHQDVKIPILMLSKGRDISKIVSCLERGADDCMDRDFDEKELEARIQALLRRFSVVKPASNIYKIKDVSIDLWKRVVSKGDKEVKLRRKEFELLELFIENKGRALSRDLIFQSLWKDESITCFNIVDVHVCYLRKALRNLIDVELIKTVYGHGYFFDGSDLQKSS